MAIYLGGCHEPGTAEHSQPPKQCHCACPTCALRPHPASPQGRILVFSAIDGKLSLVCEKETRGAVYNVLAFQGMLLTGINSRVQLYRWVVYWGWWGV